MRLNHNLASLNVYREYLNNLKSNSVAMKRVSSGQKINSAKDDPNNLAKSERMRMNIRGLQMANRNVQDGVSMLQSADGALSSMNSILGRIRELSVQYGSGSNSEKDKEIIKEEINEMIESYEDVINNSEFNGVKLFQEKKERSMQLGSDVGDTMDIEFFDLKTELKTLTELKKKDTNTFTANEALDEVDKAINKVVDVRSKYGAIVNKFEGTMSNLSQYELITQESESRVRDADIAEEMTEVARTSILLDAGRAIMAQTNQLPQDMLKILDNVRVK
ncbi:flagellin [Clostridium tetani]|uniref:flagellin n=1 Tax=Clostridium tetani TaxID=1513 RepID=UPI00100B5B81|nr:flagellin [Clostridium tetani]RXI51014.1 flagellin [Clostridium tetani]RXI51126.1 flagellin [Clostridium tetani]RXM57087.1 flagellin [Clostridium tetani]RXM68263.1 flagellin [Clostridium tetani]